MTEQNKSARERLLDAIDHLGYDAYDAPRFADFDSWEAAIDAIEAEARMPQRAAGGTIDPTLSIPCEVRSLEPGRVEVSFDEGQTWERIVPPPPDPAVPSVTQTFDLADLR